MRRMPTLTLIAAALLMPAFPASGESARPARVMSIPVPDADRGRIIFVAKGCVVCHAVNGVGGKAGPALDASEPAGVFDPLDFAARMWRGAPAMIELQSLEFGYQIDLTANDIADLAAFAENHEIQRKFSEDEIPEIMRGWTLEGYELLEAPQ
ncbi:c-type cytochrome [Limibaculum sp. M0105]|uniref:C-type cytochrome n=1 Tax=Thermohalobaculum xanthum TaxID=2753746 RepID=A0A8J7M798_9RHOB|nr:c-type cytochrome [Thermohalobaculum xanthum]MBK0398844.1 c-type cytochrome [Thermohalobaculum xanthum]